jgi:hypothetical protein
MAGGRYALPSAVTARKDTHGDLWWLFRILTTVASTLAVVALAQRALVTWRPSAPLALVMDAYYSTARLLLGWAQPYFQAALTWLASFAGWRPTLHTHWRDIFVVCAMWVAGASQGYCRSSFGGLAWAVMAGGIAGALVAALSAGMLPLYSADHRALVRSIAFLAVVFSIAAPMIAMTNDSHQRRAITCFLELAVTLAIVANFFVRSWPTPGYVFILTTLTILVGTYCLVLATVFYLSDDKDSAAYVPLFAVGLTILGAFMGPALFFAVDSGLKLLQG